MRLTGNSLQFDETGCTFDSNQNGTLVWMTAEGDVLGVSASNVPPDINADIHSAEALREHYRQFAAGAGMGLIEADPVTVDGCPAVWVLLKAPQESTGNSYTGSLVIPFRDGCLIFRIQCKATSATGVRDPLARLRRQRRTILETATLRPQVKTLAPFVYPPEAVASPAPRRAWWQRGR
jgi:hypothetical protein